MDASVLASGLLSTLGPPAEVVRLVAANRVRLLCDPPILAEYQQVLTRPKFPFAPSRVQALLAQVEADGELVTAPRWPDHQLTLTTRLFWPSLLRVERDVSLPGISDPFLPPRARN